MPGGTCPSRRTQLDEPIDLIARLAASPRWASLRTASCVYTEIEFLLAWPPGNPDAEAPYIQGFIDCLYQDSTGDWHLLDYKTNRVSPETLASTVASYEMQMLVYALAVERILKRPPGGDCLAFSSWQPRAPFCLGRFRPATRAGPGQPRDGSRGFCGFRCRGSVMTVDRRVGLACANEAKSAGI